MAYDLSYQEECEHFALYGCQEQESRDYEDNARYDYIRELEAEHYDPCSDPANACYDGYDGATAEEAETAAAEYRNRCKRRMVPIVHLTPFPCNDGLPF